MDVESLVPWIIPPSSAQAPSMIIRSPNPLAAVLVHISVKLILRQSGVCRVPVAVGGGVIGL